MQESPSLGCSFPSSSYSLSPHGARTSQKMGLKSKFRLGEAPFSLCRSQVTQLYVSHYRQATILPEKPHLVPYLGGLSAEKTPNLSRSSAKAEGGDLDLVPRE